MAQIQINLLQSGIEQGNIGSSGNTSSTKYVRTTLYIPYIFNINNVVTISATSSNTAKTVQCELIGYVSDTTTSRLFYKSWYNTPYEFDISSYSTVKFLRVVIRYSDSSVITPEEITSCTLSYNYMPIWSMDGEQPIPTQSMPIQQGRFVKPYPASLWRIDESNDGMPYNDLMLDILYHEPEPPPPPEPTEIPTVQPTATTEITDQTSLDYRRYMNGYTNPNLYRFRDGELPENTECDVFIKGTHSHRYTSINDYEDFSTECEIP